MFVIITKVEVDWGEAFLGYVPSKNVFQAGSLYTCKHSVSTPEVGDTERFLF